MCAYICISHMNWSVTVSVLRNFEYRVFHDQMQWFLLQFHTRKMVPVKLIPKEGWSQITIFLILRETTRFEWAFIIWQSRQRSLQGRGRITRNEHNPGFVRISAPNISKLNLQIVVWKSCPWSHCQNSETENPSDKEPKWVHNFTF